jgi:glucose/arabinose dehydrogenase
MKIRPLLFLAATVVAHGQLVRQANTTLAMPSALPAPAGYNSENALGALTFTSPLCVRALPGVSDVLFVVERGGTLQRVNLTTNTKSTFLNLAGYLTTAGTPISTSSESGFLSVAFHPLYQQNGLFFLFYSFRHTTNGELHQRVARMRAVGTPGNYNAATMADTSTHTPLISQRDQAGNHNGGDLHFGADGYLYISTGDEGAQYDGDDNGRRINKDFLGGIARIDVDMKPGSLAPNPHSQTNSIAFPSAVHAGTYTVPADNPFIGLTSWNGFTFAANTVRTEWWSHGYRNPWRMSFDVPTGRLFVADVGQDNWEEVSIITRGANAGWSWREGAQPHTPAVAPTTAPTGWTSVAPIYDYPHSATASPVATQFRGNSITGGVVYRGARLSELAGQYIFADYVSGRMWAIQDTGAARWTPALLRTETANTVTSFGLDPRNGDVLFTSSNTVRRLVRSFGAGTPAPATLSATGAFTSLAALTPAAGIVAYEPNVSFWSDHAQKRRWFSIPSLASRMTYAADGLWGFPNGQVWIKHFDIELERGNAATRRRLETRFLVKNAAGAYGVTYKWRPDGSDADLVGDGGLDETLAITENGAPVSQTWHYPSRAECMACHTPAGGYALGFSTRQMNRPELFGAVMQNQVTALSDAGYFTAPAGSVQHIPALARAGDSSASLEWRVRSYLEANCVHCHQPGVGSSLWDARSQTPTDAAGLIDGALVNNGGNPLNRWAVPGNTAHSMVLGRMTGAGGVRMPPVGSTVRDLEAEALVTEWIQSLPSRQSYAQWRDGRFPAPGAPEAQTEGDADKDGSSNAHEYLHALDPLQAGPGPLLSAARDDAGGMVALSFPQPANVSALVEMSTDAATWVPWAVPGNALTFPAMAQSRTVTGPLLPRAQFRVRYGQP